MLAEPQFPHLSSEDNSFNPASAIRGGNSHAHFTDGKTEGQRGESLVPRAPSPPPLPSESWEPSLWSWVATQDPRRGGRGAYFCSCDISGPTRWAWGLPPTPAPAPPSYLKIIRLLGSRVKQTDAELSVIGSGGLDGGRVEPGPSAALTPSTPDCGGEEMDKPSQTGPLAPLPHLSLRSRTKVAGITIKCQRKRIRPLPPATLQGPELIAV